MEKYLKDRKGRKLSLDEINHYMKVAKAIRLTIELTYFGVNWDIGWDAIRNRLPKLKDQVESILLKVKNKRI